MLRKNGTGNHWRRCRNWVLLEEYELAKRKGRGHSRKRVNDIMVIPVDNHRGWLKCRHSPTHTQHCVKCVWTNLYRPFSCVVMPVCSFCVLPCFLLDFRTLFWTSFWLSLSISVTNMSVIILPKSPWLWVKTDQLPCQPETCTIFYGTMFLLNSM